MYLYYDMSEAGDITVEIYSIDAWKVREHKRSNVSGQGRIPISTENLAPGIYFYRSIIKYSGSEEKTKPKKLVITK